MSLILGDTMDLSHTGVVGVRAEQYMGEINFKYKAVGVAMHRPSPGWGSFSRRDLWFVLYGVAHVQHMQSCGWINLIEEAP